MQTQMRGFIDIVFVLFVSSLQSSFTQTLSCDLECQPGTIRTIRGESPCSSCIGTQLGHFSLWTSAGQCEQTCRDGYYSTLVNNVVNATAVCLPIIDHSEFMSQSKRYVENEWPYGMRPVGSCSVPSNTGERCNVACPRNVLTCSDNERYVSCIRPWKPFCAPCDVAIPFHSYKVERFVPEAMWSQNFENVLLKSVYWIYNDKADFMQAVNLYGARPDRVQTISSKGALRSQIWLSNVNTIIPNPMRTLPGNAVIRFYVSKQESSARYASNRGTTIVTRPGSANIIMADDDDTWNEVVQPIDSTGIQIAGDNVNVDEVSIIRSLVTPYAGVAPSFCMAGLFMVENVCMPCEIGFACIGDSKVTEKVACPSSSKSLPGSNTCICLAGQKAVYDHSSALYTCKHCVQEKNDKYNFGNSEDCSRGYVKGTLVAWQNTPMSPPSKLKQLSCGPHSCCAVNHEGKVLCWGDNTNNRLGSDLTGKPWIFARDAFPVKFLRAPAVAVAVSQQVSIPTVAENNNDLSCALLEDGTVTCWGKFQCCPRGASNCASYITKVCTPSLTVEDSACGFYSTINAATILRVSSGTACVTTKDGEIWCWGRDACTLSGSTAIVASSPQRVDADYLGASSTLRSGTASRNQNTGLWPEQSYLASELSDFALGDNFICGMYACSICILPTYLGKRWSFPQQATVTGGNIIICAGRDFAVGTWTGPKDMIMGVGENAENYFGVDQLMTAAGDSFIYASKKGSTKTDGSLTVQYSNLYMNDGSTWPPNAAVRGSSPRWNTDVFLQNSASQGPNTNILTHVEVSADSGGQNFACVRQLNPLGVFCYTRNPIADPPNMWMDGSIQGGGLRTSRMPPSIDSTSVMALGQNHACVGLINGNVLCWGQFQKGRLGETTCSQVNYNTPILLQGLKLRSFTQHAKWTVSLTTAEARKNYWKIMMGGSISHPLALVPQTRGRYVSAEPTKHWVHVRANVKCVSSVNNCKIILAANMNVDNSVADLMFHVEDITKGQTKYISSVFWADLDTDISLLFYDDSLYDRDRYINVTSVTAYEDKNSCAFNCTEGSYMRNGHCISCIDSCPVGSYSDKCDGSALIPVARDGQSCTNKPSSLTSSYVYKQGTQCYWECNTNFFQDPVNPGACHEARTTLCNVGEFLKGNTQTSDATCVKCTSTRPTDTNRVFVTHGNTDDTCSESCIQGTYLTDPLLACSVCNAERCVVHSADTPQWKAITPCTSVRNAQCIECIRPFISNYHFTGHGGSTCQYNCDAGFRSVSTCGKWDDSTANTTMFANTDFTHNDVIGGGTQRHTLRATAYIVSGTMARLIGTITVSANTLHSKVEIYTSVSNSPPVRLMSYFPRISTTSANTPMHQPIFHDWKHTSGNIDMYAIATDTPINIQGLSLYTQGRLECGANDYTCVACDPSGNPPQFGSYIVSNDCEWKCDEDHELQDDDTCKFCPLASCETGKYMSGCAVCSPCVVQDTKSYFTSPGVRDQNTSCETSCIADHYKDYTQNVCRQCTQSITCEVSMFVKQCSDSRDMFCERCKECEPGTYMHMPCSESVDTVCMPCTNNESTSKSLPEFASWASVDYIPVEADVLVTRQVQLPECSWICDDDYIEDRILHICKICTHECMVGEYESDCTNITRYNGCSPCVKPRNSSFTSRGRQSPDSCAWKCDTGLDLLINGTCTAKMLVKTSLPFSAPCELSQDSCDTGNFLNKSAGVCKCQSCSPLSNPSLSAFAPGKGCHWNCKHPYMRSDDMCVRLIDLMRSRSPLVEIVPSTPEPMQWNTSVSAYVEPVTQLLLVAQNGELVTINPLVVIVSAVPFCIVFLMVTVMICRG